jgi:plastocyanin
MIRRISVPSRFSRLFAVAAAASLLVLGACGGDDQQSGSDATTPQTTATTATSTTAAGGTATTAGDDMAKTEFKITGKNIKFSPDKLTIPLNTKVEITFDNRDASVLHNIHFKTPTEVKSDIKEGKSGGTHDELELLVDKAGTYEFLCDVHPTMKGELTVQ